MRKKKRTVSRLHSAVPPRNRLGEKLRRGRLRKIAGKPRQHQEGGREEEPEVLDRAVLRHRPRATTWE